MRRPAALLFVLLTALGCCRVLCAGDAKPASGSKVQQVIVVFKTHFDIGYTDLARNVVQRYRTTMIDKALEVCDSTQKLPPENRFVWTLPGWPMTQILWPGQTPERRARIEKAIRDGRLVWHALPVTTHTESLDLEDFVRGMRFSSELSRRFGQAPARDAKMTDVPSHSWIVPTVLKHAGVDFLHLGCNSASASPDVPMLFWWEGPDGSRLLTMYAAGGYGTGLKPPKDWPHKTWLALIHTGDNHGPPKPGEVQKLLEQARRELPGVKLRMGRLSDFADAILREKPDLPVVRKDMPDTWIHGLMSMPVESGIARNVRPEIAALQALATLLRAWGVDVSDNKSAVADAYEGSLMYGEHTWGASVPLDRRLYGPPWEKELAEGRYARMEESWREHGAYIRKAAGIVRPGLAANVHALARSVAVAGPRIVVFNPLPWPRDGLVAADVPPGFASALKDTSTGDVVPAELEGNTLRFVATNVPPLGYRTYVPAPQASVADRGGDASRSTIENAFLRVRLETARGVVASLVDKRTGRELADTTSKYGLGQYLYERFDADDNDAFLKTYCKYIPSWYGHFARFQMPPAKEVPYKAASPGDFKLEIHRGPVSQTAVMTAAPGGDVPHGVRLAVTLWRDRPCVDLKWSIKDKRADTWPEAGWLCLPLNVEKPVYRLGRLGAVVDPAADCARGANFEVFCLSSGMTVTEPNGLGVGLCPLDSPLVSIGRPGVYRYTREFGPRQPVVLVNLFNNVWGTNFQQWMGGSWSCRVRLWAVEGKGVEKGLLAPSWEARSPCLAALFDGLPGRLPPTRAGIGLSRRGVLVTAFGSSPDGNGILLRLWEQAGEDGACRVTLPEGLRPKEVQPCDLRGRPLGKPIPVHDGQFDLPLGHYAPASVIMKAAR